MSTEQTQCNEKAEDLEALPNTMAGSTKEGLETSSESDATIISVFWEEPANQDPENPMNWSDGRKWGIIGILSLLSFLSPLASSMLAPGVPLVLEEFKTDNDQLATFVVSAFVLGFAVGPPIVGPLSELYGRTRVYHGCNALFTVLTVACGASKNIGMLVAFRFLAGTAGVAVITCGSGTIVDLMPPERRGVAMALWSLGPMLGPVVGPVAAGFLVAAKGWRWVFWIIAIAYGTVTFISFFVLRETYGPEILERKAARLRKEHGSDKYQSKLKKQGTPKQLFFEAIVRPVKMFCLSPIVMILCIYIAVLYGFLYILFTTFTFVYEGTYGFSSEGAGLSFIAGGIGNILGVVLTGVISDKLIQRKKARNEAPQPEDRLNLIITGPCAILLPAGLIIYGWSAYKHIHWIVPMIGTAIMGFGMIGVFMSVQTYLVDSFQAYAASVTAANGVLRSILGAVLPLVGLQLYDKLGLGWGNTLLGLILLGLAPTLWIFNRIGRRLRESPKFRKEF